MLLLIRHGFYKQISMCMDTEKHLFLKQALNYNGNEEVLSTPFLFYFGLKPGKTALDLLIKYFGSKGAFPLPDTATCAVSDEPPSPSPSVTPSTSPPSRSPSPMPSPSPPAIIYYYRLVRCVDNLSTYYARSTPSTYLSVGTAVWAQLYVI